ncbi:MAG TPA: NHLP family bacteriocin export ABC transporter peptidase/permease/ATPase subunit [Candidatus Limnocylindrales bacterium]|nr:NHLP family bacteriocin export ABC transporter peptidase/permease/ATPase subunit [Candidatus Limnocylindrales bacterium]
MKSAQGLPKNRVRTPMVLQMETVECGAAALAIILAHHGRIVPLATVRRDCGVSRDGAKVSNILKAAKAYGLVAKAFKRDIAALNQTAYPYVAHWKFKHFVVVEGYRGGRVYLNDPATGRRSVSFEEFDSSYTGIVMTFEPGPEFERGGEAPSVTRGLWRLLRRSLVPIAAATCIALLLVAPGLAMPALMAAFVDKVLVEGMPDWGRPLVLGMLATAVLRVLLSGLQFRILRQMQNRLSVAETSRFVWHLLRLPASYYSQRGAGEVSSRIALNDQVADILSGKLATTSIDILMMIFYLIVMWRFSRPLTAVAFGFAALNLAALRLIARSRGESNARLSMEQGKAAAAGIAGLQSIRTIKASAQESEFFARWAGFFAGLSNAHAERSAVNYYAGVLPPLLLSLMTAAVLVEGGFEVIHGHISIGMLVAFQSLAASFLQPVNNLVALGASLQELESHLARISDVLESHPAAEVSLRSGAAGAMPLRLRGDVEFRNVSFGYSPVLPPLIQDLSFTVRPGQRIAFVGASGSGKSTVARLMAGLYAPVSGEILFDGVPASAIPREVLSQSLAMVDQDVFLFKGTVRDNLTLWDSSMPMERLHRACSDAMIETAIDALPDGYSSGLLEGAANLSGGQRQRLEIARALACEPSILILDEATSALDAETELFVDRNIRRRGCSCIIVAHRLSTVRDSDEIIVLQQGQVVQRGTHDRLMREDGPYALLIADHDESAAAAEAAGGQ